MKKYIFFFILLFIQTGMRVTAQDFQPSVSGYPLKSINSVVYGTDILIHPVLSQDQLQCKVSVSFNGWIYAAYIIRDNGLMVTRSTDNGQTWTYSGTLRAEYRLTSIDIIVTGNTLSDLRIWVVNSGYLTSSIDMWDVDLEELNADLTSASSHTIESMISDRGYWGVAIASDYTFPSAGTSPYSLAVLYSKGGTAGDNIIFKSSSTGSAVFDNTQVIAGTDRSYYWVALSYGRSPAYPGGKYFAAWKMQYNPVWWNADYQGWIYTSFTTGPYNGPWSTPLRVDTLVQTGYLGWNHPSIASQISDVNNSVSGLSTVILFDTPDMGGVFGVFNLNPFTSGAWSPMTIGYIPGEYSMQPDVTFENILNTFFITWCDSTNQQLKVAVQDMNMNYPSNWFPVASGYNDTANLIAPFPKIRVNTAAGRLVNVWTGNQNNGVGKATFDGANLLTGIPKNKTGNGLSVMISPNPARDYIDLNIVSKTSCKGILKIFDISGKELLSVNDISLNPGQSFKRTDISDLVGGIYQVVIRTDSGIVSARLAVMK